MGFNTKSLSDLDDLGYSLWTSKKPWFLQLGSEMQLGKIGMLLYHQTWDFSSETVKNIVGFDHHKLDISRQNWRIYETNKDWTSLDEIAELLRSVNDYFCHVCSSEKLTSSQQNWNLAIRNQRLKLKIHNWLVVWNNFLCSHILGIIIPID